MKKGKGRESSMSESRKSFFGKTVSRKVISWLLVLAMMIGLVPADLTLVAKAAGEMNVALHFQPDTTWEKPAIQVWDGSPVVTGDGEAEEVTG